MKPDSHITHLRLTCIISVELNGMERNVPIVCIKQTRNTATTLPVVFTLLYIQHVQAKSNL